MLRNTRSFEKNSFIRFLRLSQVRSLFASEYEQAQTAYERYINCIQRLFRPGKLSPADTLHMMAKLKIKLMAAYGTELGFYEGEKMVHDWILATPFYLEAFKAIEMVGEFYVNG